MEAAGPGTKMPKQPRPIPYAVGRRCLLKAAVSSGAALLHLLEACVVVLGGGVPAGVR
jgi:hypothetical protein